METRAHHVLIGLFTVLTVGAALLFALWLAKSSADREFDYYDVIFTEAVSGLSRGGVVQYSGIKVGEVVELKLDPKDPRRVIARVRLNGGTPVRQDTRAKLTLAGITGTSLIQLSGGTPSSPALTAPPGKVPRIVASPSPFARLLADGEDLMSNVNNLLISANRILSLENAERIDRTLEHLEQTTGAIAGQSDNFAEALEQLALASREGRQAMHQLAQLMDRGNGLLDDQGRSILVDAQKTMASLERSSQRLDLLIESNQGAVDGGLRGLNQLGPALQDLRNTLRSLQGVSRQLEENPADYLLGRDKPKEFQP
ncbi:MlaD family protein [Pseudomonas mangrovi]|uniref:MCE family protein n=1 Tax=Pseudomonas mangrovi TaxID=2161748 RepID=A0A2T5P9Y5_9PSED|nr:MlaD family protein [Pseudomonas mangrovi]PTU74570.1 MCE family protein [Pseudomonas mangrovi]